MKKIFFGTALLLSPMSCFAYHKYYDDSSNWILWLLAIWGVLNIILFFKIWVATNDIADIRRKSLVSHNDLYSELRKLKLQGKNKEALSLLNEHISSDIEDNYKYAVSEYSFDLELKEVIKKYEKLYKAFGEEMPENIRSITGKEYSNLIPKNE